MAALVIFTQVEKNIWFFLFVLLCYVGGMLAEIIGVNTGYLFGAYSYGNVLGVQIMKVPLIIGINWFTTMYCSGCIIYKLNEWLYNKLGKDFKPSFLVQLATFVFDAALLATFFDWILEPTAIALKYWSWTPGDQIPIFNFVCWFAISAILLTFFRLMRFNKENQFAVHLFIIQVLFFLVLQAFL